MTGNGVRRADHRTAVFAVLCAAMLLAVPCAVALDDDLSEDSEAVVWAIPVAFAVGALVVWAMDFFNGQDAEVAAGSEESVYGTLRDLAAQLVVSNYDTASGMFSKLMENDTMLWSFVYAYFDSQAETAAALLWSPDGTYDGDKILETSGTLANVLVYHYNAAGAWNEFADSWSDWRQKLSDGGAAYDGMEVYFQTDNGTWGADSGTISTDLMYYVTPTKTSQRVWIDVVDPSEDGYADGCNSMLLFGGSGTLTSLDTGRRYSLSDGVNDLEALGVSSGWYLLSEGPTYVAMNLGGSVSADGLMPQACMVLTNGDGSAYAYMSGGDAVIVYDDGSSERTSTLEFCVSYRDDDAVSQVQSTDVLRVLSSYTGICDAMSGALVSANVAGAAAWQVYDALERSSTLIHPSSIVVGTQTGTSLTADQTAAMYLAVLQQLVVLGGDASPDDITISDSFDLICYGDIWYDGVCIAENAVYTPFVYSDTTISVGTHALESAGIAMVWATSVEDIEAWLAHPSYSDCAILNLTGMTLDTLNIYSGGVEVSSVTLEVASMERLGLVGYQDYQGGTTPTVTDASTLLMIIIILIGAIFVVAGLFMRSLWVTLIGMVIAVVGWLFSGTIAGWIW